MVDKIGDQNHSRNTTRGKPEEENSSDHKPWDEIGDSPQYERLKRVGELVDAAFLDAGKIVNEWLV